MKTVKLWEIGDEMEEIAELIAEAGGEITEEIEARLEAVEGAFDAKVERVALLIQSRTVQAAAAKSEEDRLKGIRNHYEQSVLGLKRYLLQQMRRAGVRSVETHRARVRVQKNGQASLTYNGDVDSIPEAFRRVTVVVDKKAALDFHKSGGDLPAEFIVDYNYHVHIQ
jgi:uncharacterized protein YktA (UPF0223 family)